MSDIQFDSPASRVIKQFSGKDEEQFRIPVNLPDMSFLRALSVQGRLWYEQASTTATNANLLTRTVSNGTTDFYFSAIINVEGTGSYDITITTNDLVRFSGSFVIGSFQLNLFDSLVGDGIKTINVAVVETGAATLKVSLFGWSENTSRIRDVTI